jgi:hypothetical protein
MHSDSNQLLLLLLSLVAVVSLLSEESVGSLDSFNCVVVDVGVLGGSGNRLVLVVSATTGNDE